MMPERVSRESIEAELNADVPTQLRAVVQELKREVIELDNTLMRAEALMGNPAQWRSDAVPDRMRRVGVPEDVIAKYERMLRWLAAMASGRPMPDDLLQAAEDRRAIRASVEEQLARIVAGKKQPDASL
jgi:hypothetical protein